jgi:hypothetical protein
MLLIGVIVRYVEDAMGEDFTTVDVFTSSIIT